MHNQNIDVVVVGAGQAGIAMSEHLSDRKISHVVLERGRVAERWRSERWDSLKANGPVWHDKFPGLSFDVNDNEFASKEQVAEYFVAYAHKFAAPVRTGVEVLSVVRHEGRPGFQVETSDGSYNAQYVVAATGPFQRPLIPELVAARPDLLQLHSSFYRNPQQLPDGAVLVVGAGSSGVQIAAEIRSSGREVYLAVGPHDRPPRRYRGHDFVWWLGVLSKWDAVTPRAGAEHVTIAVSGAHGGNTVDFRMLAASGITLTGRAVSCENGVLGFNSDLGTNITNGDANYLSLLDEADAYVLQNGLDLPEEPEARILLPDPEAMTNPLTHLNIADAGIATIIWATGFAADYSWLPATAVDEKGKPRHQRGISAEAGIYFLGLPWQSRRGSSFIWGVWHDAKFVADQISIRQSYLQSAPMPVRSAENISTGVA